jgi:hypothetical protein
LAKDQEAMASHSYHLQVKILFVFFGKYDSLYTTERWLKMKKTVNDVPLLAILQVRELENILKLGIWCIAFIANAFLWAKPV